MFLSIVNVSALVTCNINSISLNNSNPSQTFSCSNNLNNSVSITYYGSYATLSINSIPSNSSQSITLSRNPSMLTGEFSGFAIVSDSISIPVSVSKIEENACNLNPSMASYSQSIQTSTTIPLNKITFSPINCQGSIIYYSSHIYI